MGEIAVIKKELLFQEDCFQGFKFFHECPNFEARVLKNFFWHERESAEINPKLKQPIAYCLIWNPKTKKLFCYARGGEAENYKEKRLQGRLSIGIGGHVEKEDYSENIIRSSLKREINEEVFGIINAKITLIGYLNDDTNSVGKVHFGFVFLIETESEDVRIKEEGKWGKFEFIGKIKKDIENPKNTFDDWTKIVIGRLLKEKYFD